MSELYPPRSEKSTRIYGKYATKDYTLGYIPIGNPHPMFTQLSPASMNLILICAATACTALSLVCIFQWQRNRALHALYENNRGIDPLTGLWTRIRFMELSERQINHVQRTGRNAAALIIDIDHCQKINEKYGHRGGDLAVQYLARCSQTTVRDYDLLGRYSGEELAMILPDTTLEGACAVARRLRDSIAEQDVITDTGEHFLITVSIGISVLSNEMHTLEDVLLAADAALSIAKEQGHNRTVSQPV